MLQKSAGLHAEVVGRTKLQPAGFWSE